MVVGEGNRAKGTRSSGSRSVCPHPPPGSRRLGPGRVPRGGIRAQVVAALALAAGLFAATPCPAQSEEPWLIFDPLHGDLSLRYEDTDLRTESASATGRDQYYFDIEELNLRQRITVYDPRFIDLNLRLGVQWRHGHKDREGDDSRINSYSLSASALPEKSVSFNAFAAHYQSEVLQAPTAITLEDRTEQSVGMIVKEDTGSPVPVSLRYQRVERAYDNRGNGPDPATAFSRVLARDETTRSFEIESRKDWEHFGLGWQAKRQKVETVQHVLGARSDTQYELAQYYLAMLGRPAPEDRLRWQLQLNGTSQSDFPRYRTNSADGNAVLRVYEDYASGLEATLRLGSSVAEQEAATVGSGLDTTEVKRVEVGLNHRLYRSLYTELRASNAATTAPGHTDVDRVSSLAVRYSKKIPDGAVHANVRVSAQVRESEGTEVLLVTDEQHVLYTSQLVQLAALNIDTATIVATDIFKTVTYTQDVDYRITVSGLATFIEKIGPGIEEGQAVLVSYQYISPAVTIRGRTISYGYGARWRFVAPYARVTRTREETDDPGSFPDLALNPGRSEIYGVNLEETFWNKVTPRATVETETNRFRRDPFHRVTRTGQVQILLDDGIGVSIHRSLVEIDHLESPYDSDVSTVGADAFYARGRLRIDLRANRERSQVANSLHTIGSQEGRLSGWYGQWVLTSTLRLAHDIWENADVPSARFDRRFTAFTVGLKRTF